MNDDTKDRNILSSFERGLRALMILGERDEVRITDVAEYLNTSRATALRILQTLEASDFVQYVEERRSYRLGPKVAFLAARSLTYLLGQIASPMMAELVSATGETANLAILSRGRLLYAAIYEGKYEMRMDAAIGQVAQWHSTALGKAVLCQLPEDEWESLLGQEPYPATTENTIRLIHEMTRELRTSRARGYAVDDQETEPGVICIASSIAGRGPYPLGALSISGPTSRLVAGSRRELGSLVQELSVRISARWTALDGAD